MHENELSDNFGIKVRVSNDNYWTRFILNEQFPKPHEEKELSNIGVYSKVLND